MFKIVLKSNGVLVSEKQASITPLANQCIVKITNAGICSSDIFRGFQSWAYCYPLVMGHELSGVIERVGVEVKNFLPGDRVAVFPLLPCFSCSQCVMREYTRCKSYSYYGSRENGGFCNWLAVNEWNLIKIPDSVDLIDACLIEPMSVVIHALNKFIKSDELTGHIVILGAGFLGTLTSKLLLESQPRLSITLVDRNQTKLNAINIDTANKFRCADQSDWIEFTNQRNSYFDYVLETTGAPQNVSSSIKLCKAGGEIVLLGNVTSDHTLEKAVISSILRKEIKIIGSWNSSYKSANDDWITSLELMAAGARPSHLVSHQIPMSEVPNYLKKMFEHKMRISDFEYTKVVAFND